MDFILLQKHIESHVHQDINPKLKEDNSNLSAFFCADVIGARRFVLNRGGYPMSEIAQINAAADLSQQMNLLQQLEDFTPDSNPNAGLSDAEIMLGHRSKYCQTASEQIGWLEDQMHIRASQREAAKLNQQSDDGKINFDGNENTES